MARSFERDLVVATAGLSPQAVSRQLATFARAELAKAIQSGEASRLFETFVNGRRGVAEQSVVAPGPIEYRFNPFSEIIEFALQTLVERSPRRSGRYRESWFVMVNGGRPKTLDEIPAGATVIVSNDQPYSRKIDVGHMQMSVPPGVVEYARKKIVGRYGNLVTASRTMIPLPNGYVLKGHFTRGRTQLARKRFRHDTEAGAQMTYPALAISPRM